MNDHTTAEVTSFPNCDFSDVMHNGTTVNAQYDGRTIFGSWAYMCGNCWRAYGIGQLGEGYGQRLVLVEE